MKLAHLSDLHLGKRVNGFSLLEDQRHMLREILEILAEEQPDAVVLAGDLYDKPVPPAEAVELLDAFLVELAAQQHPVLAVSGNHDSPERIAFAARLLEKSGVYVSGGYDGEVRPVTLQDAWGAVDFWLLPFLKPAHVRRCWPEAEIVSYTDAVRQAVAHLALQPERRNVLVTHQFVAGAERSESEEVSVGGSDAVDAGIFASFDYVALGHLHSAQSAGRETIRYCGTPMPYAFSEARREKSVTFAELGEKGDVRIRTVPLHPLHAWREIRGTYETLTRLDFYRDTDYPASYVHITLTDEEDVPDAIGKLRVIYPGLMKLDYDNRRTRSGGIAMAAAEKQSPMELFSDLFTLQNGGPMSPEQIRFLTGLMEEIWEENA